MLLSIESSCDDSSLALTDIASAKLVFHHKISQDSAHSVYGGVVPEIASRLHTKGLPEILAILKGELGDFTRLKAVAITTEPGLSVSLIEGLMMAKLLALSLRIPLIAINHLIGHFYSLFINQREAIFPMSVLLVSGGHTQIMQARSEEEFLIIAQSLDDSFGESFDKVAKMLSLGYPGGPIIESYASKLSPTTRIHSLPLPLKDKRGFGESFDKVAKMLSLGYPGGPIIESYASKLSPTTRIHSLPLPLKDKRGFSFSGLKNATRLLIESLSSHDPSKVDSRLKVDSSLNESDKALVCASFQKAAIAHISNQVEKYLKHKNNDGIRDFAIVGGASSNASLRAEIERLCTRFGLRLHLAPLEFCADNAAMIGRAAIPEWQKGAFADSIAQEVSPRSTTNYLRTL